MVATSKKRSPAPQFEDGPILTAECKRQVAQGVRHILEAVAEHVDEQGTRDTPHRVARMYDELLSGYKVDPKALLNDALFEVEYDEMVIVKDIDFHSLCEHHMLPFYGRAHVGYLPGKKVIGLSKIPRMVEMFARRLQVQERMTQQIATFLDETVKPLGVGVVVEGVHLCAVMRGVKKPGSVMVTSAVRGTFKDNPATREEFMAHVRQRFEAR
ncbi:MAG: GTP cyclohydrolase I FolE [Dehalococcoidia bacterium]|nr:GTP cyclohydrolase I FolE [Dehalococcoidia bacterium]MSQ34690.1 GTP cyclohydrolase I FolE [Dehalococcoidia bacterium]